jgi:hypothetical protein
MSMSYIKSGLETQVTAVGIRHADHVTPLTPEKLAPTSPTSGGRSVGIICSRTQAMEFVWFGRILSVQYCKENACFRLQGVVAVHLKHLAHIPVCHNGLCTL